MKVRPTEHGLQRMKERFIPACEVAQALNKGKVVCKRYDPEFGNIVAVVDHVIRGCTLRVVVSSTGMVMSAMYRTQSGCHIERGL